MKKENREPIGYGFGIKKLTFPGSYYKKREPVGYT